MCVKLCDRMCTIFVFFFLSWKHARKILGASGWDLRCALGLGSCQLQQKCLTFIELQMVRYKKKSCSGIKKYIGHLSVFWTSYPTEGCLEPGGGNQSIQRKSSKFRKDIQTGGRNWTPPPPQPWRWEANVLAIVVIPSSLLTVWSELWWYKLDYILTEPKK